MEVNMGYHESYTVDSFSDYIGISNYNPAYRLPDEVDARYFKYKEIFSENHKIEDLLIKIVDELKEINKTTKSFNSV